MAAPGGASLDLGELASWARRMAEEERRHASEMKKMASRLHHPVLRALFTAIATDSEKHAVFYESLAELAENPQPGITEDDLEMIRSTIEEHIREEAEAVERVRKLLETVDDPRMKVILSALASDEATHHAILLAVKKDIASRETISEQDVWDAVWRDSPWKGSPGG
ncbi:MAG: ferritin-like domain-containing protein [Desulfurococcales archaeon]|nr:ferritin-like domain-containing protein [Desulfurococcales archaeon]